MSAAWAMTETVTYLAVGGGRPKTELDYWTGVAIVVGLLAVAAFAGAGYLARQAEWTGALVAVVVGALLLWGFWAVADNAFSGQGMRYGMRLLWGVIVGLAAAGLGIAGSRNMDEEYSGTLFGAALGLGGAAAIMLFVVS